MPDHESIDRQTRATTNRILNSQRNLLITNRLRDAQTTVTSKQAFNVKSNYGPGVAIPTLETSARGYEPGAQPDGIPRNAIPLDLLISVES